MCMCILYVLTYILVLQGLIEDVESQLTACDQEIHTMKRYKVMYSRLWATRSTACDNFCLYKLLHE